MEGQASFMTRNELERMSDLGESIKKLKERENDLMESVQGLTAILSDMPKAHSHYDKLAGYVVRLEEIRAEYADMITEHENLRIRYDKAVLVLNRKERKVIELRYESNFGWQRIAWKLHFSESHVFKLHREALKKVADF